MFSKKATQTDEIFTMDLTFITYVKLTVKISSIFVAFLENMNFKKNPATQKIFIACVQHTLLPKQIVKTIH